MKAPEITPVESSNIAGINFTPYDADDDQSDSFGALIVKFNSGTYYKYENVPAFIGQEIFEAESVGRYFNQVIRTAYQGVLMGRVGVEIDDEDSG